MKRNRISDLYFPPAAPLLKVAAAINPKISAFIYIVDHNTAFTSALTKAIEKPEKYSIEIYTTGERLIEELKKHQFFKNEIHIVFLGYKFFEEGEHTLMNGLETLEAVKAIRSDVDVVMLYGPDEGSFGSYARKSGAFDFIPKNDNAFIRLNNIIWRIITAKRLQQKKRVFTLWLRIFVIYFLLILIAAFLYHFLL
jgi:DNA-binding NtrC family response regulator